MKTLEGLCPLLKYLNIKHMKLLYRLGYYLTGFSLGLIFLAFVFNGKKTSCNYGPSARVKNNLLLKQIQLSPQLKDKYPELNDSLLRNYISQGNVNFSKSKTRLDSCRIYHLDLESKEKAFIQISNCQKKAIIVNLELP